ncbi:hypothetical protein F5Y19DRAFT_482064 [Xylariaceae sp. FL1651]|nr:hypothetical protein F5Y19DRAFT_482064 [Xylariaceae sp. FL1651]
MSDTPNLSLPDKAPLMAHYHDEPMTLYPAALYTLVDLTDTELGSLELECEAGCIDAGGKQGTSRVLAYFIAVVEKHWQTKGVMMVTLDDDELDCNVDSFRIKAADAGLSIMNLQIGNSSDDNDDDNDGPPAPTKNQA